MNRLARVSVHVTMLLITGISAACGWSGDESGAPTDSIEADSSRVSSQIATSDYKDRFGFQSGVDGTLELRGDCFYIVPITLGARKERVIPVFQVDRVAGSTPGVLVLDGQEYAPGDSMSLVGGRTDFHVEEGMTVPDTCDETAYMFIVAPG